MTGDSDSDSGRLPAGPRDAPAMANAAAPVDPQLTHNARQQRHPGCLDLFPTHPHLAPTLKFECVVRFVTPMQDTRKSPLVCRIPTSTTHVVGSCVAGVVRTLEVDVDSYEVLK